MFFLFLNNYASNFNIVVLFYTLFSSFYCLLLFMNNRKNKYYNRK